MHSISIDVVQLESQQSENCIDRKEAEEKTEKSAGAVLGGHQDRCGGTRPNRGSTMTMAVVVTVKFLHLGICGMTLVTVCQTG